MHSVDSETICPNCGWQHEAATSIDGQKRVPQEGSISLCWRCGEFAVFNESLQLSPLSLELALKIVGDKRLMEAQRRIKEKRARAPFRDGW